jgi:hypothetical protein
LPEITEIVYKRDRNKYWVYVDGAYADSIHESVFKTLNLQKGTKISKQGVIDLNYERITMLEPIEYNGEKYYQAYINGRSCKRIRERVLPAMKLDVGTKITCNELREFETYVWKRLYGPASWKKEKVRINKVKDLIEKKCPGVFVKIVGFGADSEEELLFHPEESGKPDLSIISKQSRNEIMLVEVTGTERMRNEHKKEYWVRPDKLEYIKKHNRENIWIILHYAEPHEEFIYIKPRGDVEYKGETENIRDANEKYVKFNDKFEEVRTIETFVKELSGCLIK